jgi:hypothetical protein
MSQYHLINTSVLASTKEMKALHRARRAKERAKSGSEPQIQNTSISTATAPPAKAPACSKTRSQPSWQEMQFNLVDEERMFSMHYLERCQLCGTSPQMIRTNLMPGSGFRVACINVLCHNETPIYRSSKDAVRHWQLSAKLARP